MKIIGTSQLFATTIFMVLLTICNAQVLCGGRVQRSINNDVECTGGCILDGASICFWKCTVFNGKSRGYRWIDNQWQCFHIGHSDKG